MNDAVEKEHPVEPPMEVETSDAPPEAEQPEAKTPKEAKQETGEADTEQPKPEARKGPRKRTPQERIDVLDKAMAALKDNAAFKEELGKVYVEFVYEDSQAWGQTMETIREETLALGKELGF